MWAAQRRCASALVSAAASVARGFAGRAHTLPRWAAGAQHEIKPGAPVSAAGLLALNTLKDNPGARQQKKRVGRGIGSGMGKTSTRGHKGQKARSGNKPHLAFEGGQTPLRRRLPKRGFVNTATLRFVPLNLDTVGALVKKGRLDPAATITMKHLRDAGAVSKNVRDGIKLLGRGAQGFAASGLKIEVSRVSDSARAAVAAAGGNVTTVHYNRLSLRALLKPHKFAAAPGLPPMLPRPAAPPPKLRDKVDMVGGLPAGAPPTPIPPLLTKRGGYKAEAKAEA